MVDSWQEAVHRLFRADPELLARVIQQTGLAVPVPDTVTVVCEDEDEDPPSPRSESLRATPDGR